MESKPDERDSGLKISVSVSIGYDRRRPDTHDVLEARIDSIGLMVAGAVIVLIVILFLVPKVFQWLTSL